MSNTLKKYGPLAARVSLALVFLMSGLAKLASLEATAGMIASQGLPAAPLLAFGAAAIEVLGAASLILGIQPRIAALALAAYLVPVTMAFHNPAGLDAMAAQMQVIQILKNLAVAGGLLAVASFGAGEFALDAWRARRGAARPTASGTAERAAS